MGSTAFGGALAPPAPVLDPPLTETKIKEVRRFTDLGLKEAKELVEKTSVVVKKRLTKEEAEAIAAELKTVGASVILE